MRRSGQTPAAQHRTGLPFSHSPNRVKMRGWRCKHEVRHEIEGPPSGATRGPHCPEPDNNLVLDSLYGFERRGYENSVDGERTAGLDRLRNSRTRKPLPARMSLKRRRIK